MNANELEEQIKYLQDPRQSADYDLDYENGTVLEYLLTIRQQQADLKDADKYVLELERLYEDAKAEIEALKANRKHDFGLGEASGFIKGHKENPYKAITNTKIEPTVVSYTHPVKEQDTECQYCKQGCIRCDARKQLTDEEINKLWAESHEDGIAVQQGFTTQQHYFAHLILRKASEK